VPNFELKIACAEYCLPEVAADLKSTLAAFCVFFRSGTGFKSL